MKTAFPHLALVVMSMVSVLCTCSAGSPAPSGAVNGVNYARRFEPPTRPAFLPLPPGAVEPSGWLRDWCLAARDGFTGHMDAYDDEFKRAWAPDHKMTGERVTLVPYGCTQFRISMFPVTAEPAVTLPEVRRILFLGNSITMHGPKADIGWTGDWEMAASSPEKDYVHLMANALAQHTKSMPQILVKNMAEFERNFATYDVDKQMADLFAFDPDLVVQAILGRNTESR